MEWLKSLGLNEKQQKLYIHLLEKGELSASQLGQNLGEQRTNIYLLLDSLINMGLVEKDESVAVTRFKVTSPDKLQEAMLTKQKQLAMYSSQMKKDLPELLGLFHLNTAHEGMAYFEGIKGYEAALEDMIKSKNEVCVFGATNIEAVRPDAWSILLRKLQKRGLAKVETRIIFEESLRNSPDLSVKTSEILKKSMQVRFWGKSLFDGEIAIYGNTVVLTTYDEKLTSIVLKNRALATTFQSIFNAAWEKADH